MGLLDRHAGLVSLYAEVRATGADPFQIRMERVLSPTEAMDFRARYDLKTGLDDTVQWYRAHRWLRRH